MAGGARQIALLDIAESTDSRFASQTLAIGRFVEQLFCGGEFITRQPAIESALFLNRHGVVDPSALAASDQLTVAQYDRSPSYTFGLDAQCELQRSC
jgi:hypothetical protein